MRKTFPRESSSVQFALFKYSTHNLGDEIQSLAARAFLPRVDLYVDRDELPTTKLDSTTALVMNGWYSHRPELWPPKQQQLKPLLISMHFSDEMASRLSGFVSEAGVEFFKRHGPVGCRDLATAEFLTGHGIEAYFSGCATLTLARESNRQRSGVVLSDLSPEVEQLIRSARVVQRATSVKEIRHRVRHRVTQLVDRTPVGPGIRMQLADRLLDRLRRAEYVVTSRLHAALPCVGLGTPAVLVTNKPDDPRFGGLAEFLTIRTPAQLDAAGGLPESGDILERYANAAPVQTELRRRITDFVARMQIGHFEGSARQDP